MDVLAITAQDWLQIPDPDIDQLPMQYGFWEDPEGMVWIIYFKERDGFRYLLDSSMIPADIVFSEPALH